MRTLSVKLGFVGLLALGWAQSLRCDTLRWAVGGRWYYDGDTVYQQGGLPPTNPRWVSQPNSSTSYTWYWWAERVVPGPVTQVASGSLTGPTPSLPPLSGSSVISTYPSIFRLYIIGHQYRRPAGGTPYACVDSAMFVVRIDSPPPPSNPPSCRPDSFFVRVGNSTASGGGGTLTLPLGQHPFYFSHINTNRTEQVFGWELQGPSGYQGRMFGGITNRSPVDTFYLTMSGRHVLRVIYYALYPTTCIDTAIVYINAVHSTSDSCSYYAQGCPISLVTGGAAYLPGRVITLASGTHIIHLRPSYPLPLYGRLDIGWLWQCYTAPNGSMWGYGTETLPPSFSVVLDTAVCTLRVTKWGYSSCGTCTGDTVYFYLRGGGQPNDTIIVTLPQDTTTYLPGDTIPLPLDTVCLNTGLLTPYPDSVYWWWWYYYGPTGSLLDSGITPVVCVYPVGGTAGVYTLVYYPQSPLPAQRVSRQSQTFYLNFGARTSSVGAKPEGGQPSLYPVPTAGPFWLNLPDRGSYEVQVRDVLGRLVTRQSLEGERVHYLPLQLTPGLYLVEVQKGSQRTILRLLVQ